MTDRVITDIDEVLTTTRAVRNRMDFDRPVDRAVVEECLRLAQQAPMGSNLEDWRIVAVDDPALKRKLSELYTEVWYETVERPLAGGEAATTTRLSPAVRPDARSQARQARILKAVKYLVDHLEEVPVLVILCSTKPIPERAVGGTASGYYGSIFPFAWSFQLALRSRGLGSVMATAMAHKARKVQAVLGLPDDWRPVTLLPVAYTKGLDFRPAARADLADVAFWNGPTERAASTSA
ncbi:nitroreductase family protein [Dactylosporangium sp. NPDC048998]|uniref:nitroreductase family protein n=1 Tax=Dactylosporangium sp. NPDC048998 TaxID=3363976 RepID=UPI00371A1954